MMPSTVASGITGVETRIAQIQARIDDLTAASRVAPTAFAQTQQAVDAADEAPAAPNVSPVADASSSIAPGAVAAGTGPDWASGLPDAAQQWVGSIERAATQAGIDPALLASVVRHESNFDPSVISHAGAIGLGQLMPGTADWLGVDPYDPEQNLSGAARYLREQLDRFGTPDLALAAYNAGPNRVAQAGGIPRITETQLYVERVMSTWEQLR